MRKTRLALLAAATILSFEMLAGHAKATTLTPPATLRVAAASFVQKVVNVCGSSGCVQVQTHRIKRKPTSPNNTMR
jgi:hypothetical protein